MTRHSLYFDLQKVTLKLRTGVIFPAEALKTVTLQVNTLTLHSLDLELRAEKSAEVSCLLILGFSTTWSSLKISTEK